MFKNVDLFTRRYIQIVLVMMLVQAIYQFGHIPHNSWLITSCAIYSGFDPGSVLKRASDRVYGTFVGIALVSILWYIIHFDYRWLIILTCLMVFAISYTSQLPYALTTILNTAFSDVSLEWSNSDSFNLQYYLSDRVICNLIVVGICIASERLWFGRSNLTVLNFNQVRANIIKMLQQLFLHSQSRHNSRGKSIKLNQAFMLALNKLNSLAGDIHNAGNDHLSHDQFMLMVAEIRALYSNIVGLAYLQAHQPNSPKIAEVCRTIECKLVLLDKQ